MLDNVDACYTRVGSRSVILKKPARALSLESSDFEDRLGCASRVLELALKPPLIWREPLKRESMTLTPADIFLIPRALKFRATQSQIWQRMKRGWRAPRHLRLGAREHKRAHRLIWFHCSIAPLGRPSSSFRTNLAMSWKP